MAQNYYHIDVLWYLHYRSKRMGSVRVFIFDKICIKVIDMLQNIYILNKCCSLKLSSSKNPV